MKKFISYAFALAILSCETAMAQTCCSAMSKKDHDSCATANWKTYGSKLTLEEMTPLTDILKDVKKFEGEEVLICGGVTEVCKGKGCWMAVVCGDSHIRVEFKDYGFFVPRESEGKRVRLQGMLQDKTITAAAAKHMAEEMEHPPVKMEDIKDENVITVFVASAVAMENGGEISTKQRAMIEGKMKHESGEHKH